MTLAVERGKTPTLSLMKLDLVSKTFGSQTRLL